MKTVENSLRQACFRVWRAVKGGGKVGATPTHTRHATHDTRRHAASVIPVWVCGRCGVRVGTIVSQSVRCVIVSGRWVRESRITMVTDCGRRQAAAAAAAVRAQSRSRVSCCRSLTHSLSVSQSPARSFVRSFVRSLFLTSHQLLFTHLLSLPRPQQCVSTPRI